MPNDTVTDPGGASAGQLVSQLSEQLSRLVRDELALARAEVIHKGKKAALGAGLFGGAGLVGLFAIGTLIACGVLGLANVVSAWLAALIVGAALLGLAGVLALTGKRDVSAAQPPLPTEAIDGIKLDVATIRDATSRDATSRDAISKEASHR